MSYYFKTIPKNLALSLKDKYNLDIFIETGTYMGKTALWASEHFNEVHTVEINECYYELAVNGLLNNPNITVYLNDSRIFLHEALLIAKNHRTMFYLDAHWSIGNPVGRPQVDTVAYEEIQIINNLRVPHVIVVDDAHKFGSEKWPTKEDIVYALENEGDRNVKELLDVLIATPVSEIYKLRRTHASINETPTEIIQFGGIGN